MSTPIDIESFVVRVQDNVDSMGFTKPLTVVADDMRKAHEGYFSAQADPNGVAWAPLAPSTIKARFSRDMGGRTAEARAAGFSPDATILIDTGAMKSSVVFQGNADHVERIGPVLLEMGTKDEKAAIHQFGTGKIPARPFVGFSTDSITTAANRVADAAIEQLLAGI